MKCQHDKERTRCRECGGGSFCEHDILRSSCSLCSPEQTFKRYQRQADERGIPFLLTEAQFRAILFKACSYCNGWTQPGVDRKNNFEGYTFPNSQSCCGRCNRWKSDDAEDTFLDHAFKIVRHQEKKKLKLQSLGETKNEESETSELVTG